MSHEDVLNHLLSHSCPNEVSEEGNTYYIELHCTAFRVKARPLGNLKYEVLGCEQVKEG